MNFQPTATGPGHASDLIASLRYRAPRGRHRAGPFSWTVADITAALNREAEHAEAAAARSQAAEWEALGYTVIDGRLYFENVTVTFPPGSTIDDGSVAVLCIAPEPGVANLPVLADYSAGPEHADQGIARATPEVVCL